MTLGLTLFSLNLPNLQVLQVEEGRGEALPKFRPLARLSKNQSTLS